MILALYLWERGRDSDEELDDAEVYADEDVPYGASSRKTEPNLGSADERDLDGDADLEDDVEDSQEAVIDDDAPLLIQLSVAKRTGEFDGAQLLEVAKSCGLRPGDMNIFHCIDDFEDGPRIYFSMANMLKPGTFPFDDMEGFSTPGMSLFAQLEGFPEDLTVLQEMIDTARKLATTLGGDVLDDNRRPLTVRKEDDMRNAVLANEARAARMRRH